MCISINTDIFSHEDCNFTAQDISLDTVGSIPVSKRTQRFS